MGLCKCPKRKVTNLFCFEHRVNVCEHCLIENHPRCVVQSYLSWLKDSDYNPNCALCNITLAEGDVVRLLCYDVFHVACLEKHSRTLPPNTAPAGYKCVSCNTPIFPAPNQAGLVVDNLRDALSKYNWARVGLCLPLIDEPVDQQAEVEEESFVSEDPYESNSLHGHSYDNPNDSFLSDSQLNNSVDHSYSNNINTWNDSLDQNHITTTPQTPPQSHSTVLNIDQVAPHASGDTVTVARKGGRELALGRISLGHEDVDGANKYQRRSALTWFKRWLKSRTLPGRSYTDSRLLPRRAFVLIFFGLLAFLTFIVFATKVGRGSTSDDPKFDPLSNPNIHVARHKRDPFGNYDVIEDPLQKLQGLAGGAR